MAKHGSILEDALREVHRNIPSTVRKSKLKGKRRRKQLLAIAFSKARRAGAYIPK